jgi:adenylate kinase family enzyme
VRKVVILGPGGAGKSVFAKKLGEAIDIPVIELDSLFWQPGLVPTPKDRWAEMQRQLVQHEAWILDGDLGPYDVVEPRLRAADTAIVLDFGVLRCAWRSLHRSRERLDFWKWLWSWHRRYRPVLMQAIAVQAASAHVRVLSNPGDVQNFLDELSGSEDPQ